MPRLMIHVEGQTEEQFIKNLVMPYLYGLGYESVSVRILGNARLKLNRGGIQSWERVKNDIIKQLRTDRNCYSAIMVDYYGMPEDWPGRKESKVTKPENKSKVIEEHLFIDLRKSVGTSFNESYFIPYIVLHEFEALLFSDPEKFAIEIDKEELIADFKKIREEFSTPEEINDSPNWHPLKEF
jgi:hypothetical protein